MSKQKVLFIVPHEDDEVFVGGPMILNLTQDPSYEVFVFIATNGDYYPFENGIRIKESLAGLKLMGVAKDKIFFGGYGDSWKGTHIYNSSANEVKISHGGFEETYVNNDEYKDWHYIKYGKHAEYTRTNYLLDIQSLIETIRPDVIFAVDMDSHQDHRGLSLFVDEAMANILKKRSDYCPRLLKKLAYQGVLKGVKDFFHYPNRPTQPPKDQSSNPFFLWSERIRYRIPKSCNTLFIRTNIIYKVIKNYVSQNVTKNSVSFINSDVVYWNRHTDNLALKADITATSGNAIYLNDFKLLDTDDVKAKECDYKAKCWRPATDDKLKEITIVFNNESEVSIINLYINNLVNSEKTKGKVIFLNQNTVCYQKEFYIPCESFAIVKIYTDKIKCNRVVFNFSNTSEKFGIGEIEILSDELSVPFQNLLILKSENIKKNLVFEFIKFLDSISFYIQKRYHSIFPNKYKRMREKYKNKLKAK